MKSFKEFGIVPSPTSLFIGDKIKIDKILNREIIIHGFKLSDSIKRENSQCLSLQIEIGGEKRVIFTGAKFLIEAIKQIPENGFPFTTTITKENEHLEFQ
jgi:hypothetical protein